MNVTEMMIEMYQNAGNLNGLVQTITGGKRDENKQFTELLQKRQKETADTGKELNHADDKSEAKEPNDKSASPTAKEQQTAKDVENSNQKNTTSQGQKSDQIAQGQNQNQELSATGYIPTELLLANQILAAAPETTVHMETQLVQAGDLGPQMMPEQNTVLQQPVLREQGDMSSPVAPNTQSAETFTFNQGVSAGGEKQAEGQNTNMAMVEADAEVLDSQTSEGAEPQPLFKNVEHTPVKVGEGVPVNMESSDSELQMANVIRQAVQAGAEKVEVRLMPENLGTVTIELTKQLDGSLQVVLYAGNEKAVGLLGRHTDQLAQLLMGTNQNNVHVEVHQSEEGQQAQQQQTNPDGHGQQGNQRDSREESRNQGDDFLQQLRLGLLDLEYAV